MPARLTSLQPHPASTAAVKMRTEQDIDGLARLKANWDGYASAPLNPDILASARKLIRSLARQFPIAIPNVIPMTGGRMQFEWHKGRKSLELEIEDAETIHYLKWDPGQDFQEEGSYSILDTARSIVLLQWFAGEAPYV